MNYYGYMEYRTVLDDEKMNVYDASEGFTKGTMFKALYDPYKNYLPKQPTSMTEKGRLMLDVQMYCAAAHDFALYLDVFPNDRNVIKLRNEYLEKYKNALKNYQSKYGAITTSSITSWPWEGNK